MTFVADALFYHSAVRVIVLIYRTRTLQLFDINEAFAAQWLAVQKELGLPMEKSNINGGAIGEWIKHSQAWFTVSAERAFLSAQLSATRSRRPAPESPATSCTPCTASTSGTLSARRASVVARRARSSLSVFERALRTRVE